MNNIREKIVNEFYKIGERDGYKYMQSIGGTLSTTFSHPVFAMPHIRQPLGVHGFNTAFRPTDNDEGTHLIAFYQYYICTNILIEDPIDYIHRVILQVIKKTFPTKSQINNIAIEESPYEWSAHSTGYQGGGGEVNITSMIVAGKKLKLGQLELAQINTYAISGGIEGNPCHLIVFGIDRLINLYAITKIFNERGIKALSSITIQELYLFDKKEAALHKGLVDTFLSPPINADEILTAINKKFLDIKKKLKAGDFSVEAFRRLGYACSLAECAYASNVITKDFRNYFIHQQYKLYKRFAQHVVEHPDIHLRSINQTSKKRERAVTVKTIAVSGILSLPFFRDHFSIRLRGSERILHPKLITKELYKELVENSTIGRLIKKDMFTRAVGEDLAKRVEDLAHHHKNVHTLAGTITERIARINLLLDYIKDAHSYKLNHVNINKLKSETYYLALDWQYYSVKIYQNLEGILSEVALKQQGYNVSLAKRIRVFHTVDKKGVQTIKDKKTLLLVLVGKIDEAVSLFVRSTETGKSIGKKDPLRVKQKISVVINVSKKLGVNEDDVKALLRKTLEINPNVVGMQTIMITNYFKKRIDKIMTHVIGDTPQ